MGSRKLAAILLLLGCPVLGCPVLGSPALAQTYGLGRTPSAEEISARDINIGETGQELPPGRGTPKDGAKVFTLQGCIVCHGEEGVGGLGPALKSKTSQDLPIWKRERILPLRSPFATTVWDYINRGMPLGREGTLKPDEVYALTALLAVREQGDPGGHSPRRKESAEGQDADWRWLRQAARLEARSAKASGLPLLIEGLGYPY